MGKINIGRWVVGGLVCGLVINVLGYLVDGVMLAPRWNQDLVRLGRPEFGTTQVIYFNPLGSRWACWQSGSMPPFDRGLEPG